jgi:hypothetical protein
LLIETTKRTAVETSTSRRRRRRRRRVVRVVIRGGRCDPKRRRSVRVLLLIVLIESTELIPLRVVVITSTRILITRIIIRVSASPHDAGFSLSLYLYLSRLIVVTRLKSLSSLLMMRAFFARVKVPKRKKTFQTIPTGKSLHFLKASSSSSSSSKA